MKQIQWPPLLFFRPFLRAANILNLYTVDKLEDWNRVSFGNHWENCSKVRNFRGIPKLKPWSNSLRLKTEPKFKNISQYISPFVCSYNLNYYELGHCIIEFQGFDWFSGHGVWAIIPCPRNLLVVLAKWNQQDLAYFLIVSIKQLFHSRSLEMMINHDLSSHIQRALVE